jgi:hypothetical protein
MYVVAMVYERPGTARDSRRATVRTLREHIPMLESWTFQQHAARFDVRPVLNFGCNETTDQASFFMAERAAVSVSANRPRQPRCDS